MATPQTYTDEQASRIREAYSRKGEYDPVTSGQITDAYNSLLNQQPSPQSTGISPIDYLLQGGARFTQALGENISAGAQGLATQGGALLKLMDGWHPQNQVEGLKTLKEGLIDPSVDHAKNAWLEFMRGNPANAANQTVAALGPVGEQLERGAHRVVGGDPAGGLADFLSLAAAKEGPETIKKLQQSTTGKFGKILYKENLPVGTSGDYISPENQTGAREQGFNAGVIPRKGTASTVEAAKVQSLIDQHLAGVNPAIQSAGDPIAKSHQMLQPLLDVVSKIRSAGRGTVPDNLPPGLENPLLNEAARFVRKHSNVPMDPGDASATPPRLPETSEDYLSRAATLDPGRPLSYWNKVKKSLGGLETSPNAQRSVGEVAEKGGYSSQDVTDLLRKGITAHISSEVPATIEMNQRASQAIHLKNAIEEVGRQNPRTLSNILKNTLPIAATGALTAAGVLTNDRSLGIIGGLSSTAVSMNIARMAANDPALMSRIGLALSKAGTGPASKALGHSLKIGALGGILPTSQPPSGSPSGNNPVKP
jgi:hypothetical protein